MTCSGCASPTGNWEAGWGVGDWGPLYRGSESWSRSSFSATHLAGGPAEPRSVLQWEFSPRLHQPRVGTWTAPVTVKRAPSGAGREDVHGPSGCLHRQALRGCGAPLTPMGGPGVQRGLSEHCPCWDAAVLRTLLCLCAPPAGPSHSTT